MKARARSLYDVRDTSASYASLHGLPRGGVLHIQSVLSREYDPSGPLVTLFTSVRLM